MGGSGALPGGNASQPLSDNAAATTASSSSDPPVPQRSSSPLKRRASSIEPEGTVRRTGEAASSPSASTMAAAAAAIALASEPDLHPGPEHQQHEAGQEEMVATNAVRPVVATNASERVGLLDDDDDDDGDEAGLPATDRKGDVVMWMPELAEPLLPRPLSPPSPPPLPPPSANRAAAAETTTQEPTADAMAVDGGADKDAVDIKLAVMRPVAEEQREEESAEGETEEAKEKQKEKRRAVVTTVSRAVGKGVLSQPRGTLSGRNSPAPQQGPLTRGRAQQKYGRAVGSVGLLNLGNTCYMNSALQCVRSVEELTKYFLVHEAEKEINRDNPLGNGGDVAEAYGHLLQEIYRTNPVPTSVTPRMFKHTIGRHAPAFSGYGQQDSQEFLGFLLDGLQEDLSRIKKKPYIEKPDSTDDMINNPEAIREMAEKVWDITRRRDDSVIADLFTGMYKSTLVCPVCAKISITFDPFNNLTLPLPVENTWNRTLAFFPFADVPVELEVDIDRHSSIKTLKQFVSSRTGVPLDRLIAAEEFKGKFFKVYEDLSPVADEIQPNDSVVIYELESAPTNWPQRSLPKPKTLKIRSMLNTSGDEPDAPAWPWNDPMAERMVVPVIHRSMVYNTFNRRLGVHKRLQTAAHPHFITVTREEARSEDAIRRKILEKVRTMSTWGELHREVEDDDDTNTENTDSEMVVTTASDADSAGDSKVIAKSVGSEDDMVDVSMKDAADGQGAKRAEAPATKPLKEFNKRRPKWVDPREFLPGSLQNLFELSYFSDPSSSVFNSGPTLVPSGWRTIEDDSVFPRLSSRVPIVELSDDQDAPTPSTLANGTGTDNESSGDESVRQPVQASAPTRMVDERDSDDELASSQSNLPLRTGNAHRANTKVGHRGRKGKGKSQKTYSKKAQRKNNNRRGGKQGRAASGPARQVDMAEASAPPADDDGPLIRLGEGIVVDWTEPAWDLVYGGNTYETVGRGVPTWTGIDRLADPVLDNKKKARLQRRKHGITLDDCLDEFGKEEILSENDTWYCPRCKEHRRASKKFELWKTPDILVVHLKRFSSSGAYRRDKLDVLVTFPIENLDLRQRVVDQSDGKEEIYDLIAVDDHWGGLGGGHYTAFAKNFVDGKWYEYNDSIVSTTNDPSRIISAGAYLLFYRRRSSVPLGGPRFQEIIDRYDNQSEEEDSGEGQRLGNGSSLRGLSSALTGAGAGAGAGAIRPQMAGGSVRSMLLDTPPASGDDEMPPLYEAGSSSFDAKPISSRATDATDSGDTIHNSVEDDEAIGGLNDVFGDANTLVPLQPLASKLYPVQWSWRVRDGNDSTVDGDGPAVSGAEGETTEMDADDSGGSDKAQHDDSPIDLDVGVAGDVGGHFQDAIDLDAMDDDDGTLPPEPNAYREPEQPSQPEMPDMASSFGDYELPAPPEPDPETAAAMQQLTEAAWKSHADGRGHHGHHGHHALHHQVISVPAPGHVEDDGASSDSTKEIFIDRDIEAMEK